MPYEALGPETRALFTTRRWLDTMLALVLVAVAASRAIPSWAELTTTDQVGLFAAVLLVLAGAVLGSTFPFLWLCPAGLLALAATALVAPHGSPAWMRVGARARRARALRAPPTSYREKGKMCLFFS